MKKPFCIILFFNLFVGTLCASVINNIDEDPWLRSWLFIGPFANYETAEKLSDSLSRSNIEDIISFTQKSDNIKSYLLSSNSSVGKHSIYQYFFDHFLNSGFIPLWKRRHSIFNN